MEPIGGTSIEAVDFDYESKSVFFSDSAGKNRGIMKVNLGEGSLKSIIDDNFGQYAVKSIAVDWINCKVYARFKVKRSPSPLSF